MIDSGTAHGLRRAAAVLALLALAGCVYGPAPYGYAEPYPAVAYPAPYPAAYGYYGPPVGIVVGGGGWRWGGGHHWR